MKKTVTINLSGIIFHIDEDAHDKLRDYLSKIKSCFSDSEGKDEIMADIEARIAEIFQENISKAKEVITIKDVEEVIAVMGNTEDYMEDNGDESKQESKTASGEGYHRRKRIFRDPDDNVLGGVCSGIAAYFNFDPLWLRIAFAVALFVFGTGVLLYILLWIVIPEAKTTSEKLEMRGEKVDISNIEKSIKEELEKLKKKFSDLKNEAKNINTKPHIDRAKNIIEKIIDFVISILTFVLKAIAKFIGVIFIAIGIALIVMLLSSLFGANTILSITPAGINTFAFSELLNIFFTSEHQIMLVSAGILLLIGIPLVALTYNGIKLLLGIKKQIRGLGMITMALWITGFILCGYVSVQIANDFARKGVVKKSISILQPASNTLYLNVDDGVLDEDDYDTKVIIGDWYCFFNEGGNINFSYTNLDIIKSKTDSFEIEIVYFARGETKKKAVKRAENIEYQLSQEDSLLIFNPYFSITDEDLPAGQAGKWRNQKVKILVKVPLGGSVHLSENMERIIYDIENVSGTYDRDMLGKTWTMLEEGLTCVGCDEDEL